MGCASSKAEDLPLVALCRERRELIRAAADHRYALAAAHASYFRALDRVGDALHRFAADELVAAPASPVLTLPPSEGKPPRSKSGRSDAAASSPPSPSSSTVSPFSESHLDDECHHLHRHFGSDSEEIFERRDGRGVPEECDSFPHSIPFNSFTNTNFYYMKAAPTPPSTFYHNPYGEHWSGSQRQQFGYDYGYGYPSFVQNGTYNHYELPGMNKRDEISVAAVSEEQRPPPPPPPSPPPQGSSWDFFNLFDSYEQMLDGYAETKYGLGSVVSSPNSSEVREQEGIPDLEEETEQESVKETGRRTILEEKHVIDDDSERFNSSVGSSEAVTAPHVDEKGSAVQPEGHEENKRSLSGGSLRNSGEGEVRDVINERLRFEEAATSAVIMEDSGRGKDASLPVKDASLPVHRTKDVLEAVKEIREQFKAAACCGEVVSKVLEVGKIQYRPRIRIFKGTSMLKMSEAAHTAFEKYITMEPCNLSSTLEQLYMWEKKLYKLVKDEEKLRVFYDREHTRLKALDDRGSESNKIDSTRAAISKLITKISMTIKSVDAISRRIHKLRDEELRPQLIGLIHGLMRMWRSMLDCHQRQFQAIVEVKSQKFLLRSIGLQSLTAKATAELERELMNWCSCFSNWVRAQKAYIDALNGWLMKWLHQEQEETPDGFAPFSPGRIGAPAIFVISNDWHNMIERTSESEVLEAMHLFATNLHRLWESQDEEQQQKLKAEYLSQDFAKRLKALQKQNAENEHLDASDMIIMSASNNSQNINGHMMHLDLMRKRLDEEKEKHVNAMLQIHEVASSSLRTGLIPIFEALGIYSSQTLKGYNELRLLDNDGT